MREGEVPAQSLSTAAPEPVSVCATLCTTDVHDVSPCARDRAGSAG